MKKSFTFRVGVTTLFTLDRIAKTNNITVSSLVRSILEEWIQEREQNV